MAKSHKSHVVNPSDDQPSDATTKSSRNESAAPSGGADHPQTKAKDKSSASTDEPVVEELEAAVAEAEAKIAADEASQADLIEEAKKIVEDADIEDESEVVAQAQAEVAEWKDKYMRLHAEWDTYRRRTREQREQEKVRAAENLVTGLLPVIDDFERTIDYANDHGEQGLLGGVEAVYTKFLDVLKKDGVEIINPEGEAFDALEAQAVGTVENEEAYDETVAQVYQKGFRLGKKVLRPAMVTVTTGGPKRKVEDE